MRWQLRNSTRFVLNFCITCISVAVNKNYLKKRCGRKIKYHTCSFGYFGPKLCMQVRFVWIVRQFEGVDATHLKAIYTCMCISDKQSLPMPRIKAIWYLQNENIMTIPCFTVEPAPFLNSQISFNSLDRIGKYIGMLKGYFSVCVSEPNSHTVVDAQIQQPLISCLVIYPSQSYNLQVTPDRKIHHGMSIRL